MGHRLSKIYTRTGDDGMTGLADGRRVSKHDPRIECFGAVDETNSAIGVVLAEGELDSRLQKSLIRIQHELFDIGGELSLPGHERIGEESVAWLERELDRINSALPPLKEFILPGGNRTAAACHVARATCRRAERRAWALADNEPLNPALTRYLNRLSDLLFVMGRAIARADGGAEILWRKDAL